LFSNRYPAPSVPNVRSDECEFVTSQSGDCIIGLRDYGPKTITEEQAEVILNRSNSTIERMAAPLLSAKEKSERGELKVIDAWRNDERSNDKKLQEALAKRAEQYR
jgi:hypothetical protein